jgi:hypothetical protein
LLFFSFKFIIKYGMHTIISFPQNTKTDSQAPSPPRRPAKKSNKKIFYKKKKFQAETLSMKSAPAMLLARPPAHKNPIA